MKKIKIDKILLKISNDRKSEQEITAFKTFFRTHLLQVQHRVFILNTLSSFSNVMKDITGASAVLRNVEIAALDKKICTFLDTNFEPPVVDLYNKEIIAQTPESYSETQRPFMEELVVSVVIGLKQVADRYNYKWEYKKRFLVFLHDCLYYFGLHPNINQRSPSLHKKFNVQITHNFKSKERQSDYRLMLTFEEFKSVVSNSYVNQKPIFIGGKLIPIRCIYEIKVTTTLLEADEIELFAIKKGFVWTMALKDELAFINSCKNETDSYLLNPYEAKADEKKQFFLINHAKDWQITYPGSFNLYSRALNNFNLANHERHVLDDLRLSIETLLKELFSNQKSFENQMREIGQYFQNKKGSPEVTNMFQKLIDYFAKYQNSYVKHNDKVNKNEMEFILDLSTAFTKYLIKK